MLKFGSTTSHSWAADEKVLSTNVTAMTMIPLPKWDQLAVVSDHYTTLHSSMLWQGVFYSKRISRAITLTMVNRTLQESQT
jgi:hypothetical protein